MPAKYLTSLSELPANAVVAVGTFDGLHLGHQKILQEMLVFAEETGRPACVITFDPSPAHFFSPQQAPGYIYDPFLQQNQIIRFTLRRANLLVLPFDKTIAEMSTEAFAQCLRGCTIFCGEDWRFGKGAKGLPSDLPDVHIVPYATYKGMRVSSTRIRAAMALGQMDEVAAMLGIPWTFIGMVRRGRGLAGKTFGVPTLNIPYIGLVDERMAPLARGVYKVKVEINAQTYDALLNFGVAPSVKDEAHPLFEAHLLGASGDFYGDYATITINTPILRAEKKFDSLDELKAQIHRDLAAIQSDEA